MRTLKFFLKLGTIFNLNNVSSNLVGYKFHRIMFYEIFLGMHYLFSEPLKWYIKNIRKNVSFAKSREWFSS